MNMIRLGVFHNERCLLYMGARPGFKTHICYIWGSAVRDTNQDIVRDTKDTKDTKDIVRDTGQEANNQGHVKVTDVNLEEVGGSSKMKATENTDGSYGVRRRISTHKRRSGSCRR